MNSSFGNSSSRNILHTQACSLVCVCVCVCARACVSVHLRRLIEASSLRLVLGWINLYLALATTDGTTPNQLRADGQADLHAYLGQVFVHLLPLSTYPYTSRPAAVVDSV